MPFFKYDRGVECDLSHAHLATRSHGKQARAGFFQQQSLTYQNPQTLPQSTIKLQHEFPIEATHFVSKRQSDDQEIYRI